MVRSCQGCSLPTDEDRGAPGGGLGHGAPDAADLEAAAGLQVVQLEVHLAAQHRAQRPAVHT